MPSKMAQVKLSDIKPNPNNPRLIKDERFALLKNNIERYPKFLEKRPIVIDSWDNPIILGGNMRYRALVELKYKEIPDSWVREAKGFTDEEKRAFIILDNQEFGESDWDKLANEWDENELKDWGLELPTNFGLESSEDDYIIPDEIETDIVTVDLFEIGQHRLLCGDSTKAEDVEKAMGGCKPILMVTDPPYGVNYDASWREEKGLNGSGTAKGKVSNDDSDSWSAAFSLFNGDVAYVWHGEKQSPKTANELEATGLIPTNLIVWGKNALIISRGNYHSQHETCWYAVRKSKKHNWNGDRVQTTLWSIDRPKKSETGHSTQKPVECMARPIRNNSYERETVYDPFLGSGTTMVAAHQLNRKCIGVEINPQYCQIILERMLKLDPSLTVKKNGQPFHVEQSNKKGHSNS